MALKKSLSFLEALGHNNDRDWMQANKPAYQEARDEFLSFVSEAITLLATHDEGLITLDAKKSIFRINRDIRFSKDKSPYKQNFGMYLSEGGKKSDKAGYYFHLQPGDNSFLAGGIYAPNAENLSKIRQEIDYNAAELKQIVDRKEFNNLFGTIQGDSLKRAPKGYTEDHPNIDLLKLKSFIVMYKVSDAQILQWSSAEECVNVLKEIKPLNNYFNVAIS